MSQADIRRRSLHCQVKPRYTENMPSVAKRGEGQKAAQTLSRPKVASRPTGLSIAKRKLTRLLEGQSVASSKMELEEGSTLLDSEEKASEMELELEDSLLGCAASGVDGFRCFHLPSILRNESLLLESSGRSLELFKQREICGKMRTILVDWMLEVGTRFGLRPHTLFLAISLLDGFSRGNPVRRTKYQLLGVTVLFIAAKFEEVRPPSLRDFVYICDRSVSREEILVQEAEVLRFFDFQVIRTHALSFLEMQAFAAGEQASPAALFLLFAGLLDSQIQEFPAKVVASSAFAASRAAELGEAQLLSPAYLPDDETRGCARALLSFAVHASSKGFTGLRSRFSKVWDSLVPIFSNLIHSQNS